MIHIIQYYVYYVFELHVTCSVHLNILAGSNLGGAFKEMEMIALKKKNHSVFFTMQFVRRRRKRIQTHRLCARVRLCV